MKLISGKKFTEERALFALHSATVRDCVFMGMGESPLKESRDIEVFNTIFGWKYPLWYSKNITVSSSTLLEGARSGIWYTEGISVRDTTIDAPKTFRRSSGITLERVTMPNAKETLWACRDITLREVAASGDYFAMNCEGVYADGLALSGNYAFDGARDIEIRNAKIISKDAFWNCENVTVYDSLIVGEYLGWNSRNVRLVGCTVESNQGMCYMDGVELVGCKLINTDLAFEYSTVNATVTSSIVSVKNPIGRIEAESIDEIIIDENARGEAEILERRGKTDEE
ncbi:MAG: DUF3737 family protein [Clostridia bacterium]|nr:DUF3737 family protein [Clostridia bacterium]